MESLHGFFRDRIILSWEAEQIPDPEKDYTEFLKNINNAIDALGDNPRSASLAPESRCLGVSATTTIDNISDSTAGDSFDLVHSVDDTTLDCLGMPPPVSDKPHTLMVSLPTPYTQPEHATRVITVDSHNMYSGSRQLKDKERRCGPSTLAPFKRPRLDKSNATHVDQEDDSHVCYSATA